MLLTLWKPFRTWNKHFLLPTSQKQKDKPQLIYKFIFQQLDSLFGPQSSLKEFWRLSTRPLLVPSSLVTWRFIENLNIRSSTWCVLTTRCCYCASQFRFVHKHSLKCITCKWILLTFQEKKLNFLQRTFS